MKTFLIALISVLALVLAAVLVVPSFIDWNTYKQTVTTQLSDLLGKPVRIDGDVDFAMLPTPILTANGVTVGTPADPEAPPPLTVGALDIRVSLLPLVAGELEVERAVLVEPAFFVESHEDGRVSWVGDRMFGDVEDASSVTLGRLTIDNGRIRHRDRSTGAIRTVGDVFVQVTADSLRGPGSLIGSISYGGIAYTLDLTSGRISDSGALPLTAGIGVDGLDGDFRLSGVLLPGSEFHGDVAASGSDIVSVVRRFLPDAEGLPSAVEPFALRAPARLTAHTVALDPLTLELGDTRGTGSFSATLGSEPSISAEMALSRLDLDVWAEGLAWREMADEWMFDGAFALPDWVDITLQVSADAVDLRGDVIRRARLAAGLVDGVATIDRFSASFPGGSDVALVASVRAEEGAPWVDMAMEGASGDFRSVLGWVGADLDSVPVTRLRSLAGGIALTGTPRDFQASVVDLTIDNSRVEGGVAYRETSSRGVGMRLVVDRLDLDSYHSDGASAFLPDPFQDPQVRSDFLELLQAFDANIQLNASELTLNGTELEGLELDATVSGGTITVRKANVASVASSSIAVQGRVGALEPVGGLDLTVELEAAEPDRLAAAVGMEPPPLIGRLGEIALTARLQGDGSVMIVDLEGEMAGGTINVGGSIEQMFAAPIYDIAARVVHEDGLRIAHVFAPAFQPQRAVGAVDVYSRVLGDHDHLSFAGLQGSVGETPLAGSVDIRLTAEVPRVDADIRAGTIELDRYLPSPRRAVLSGGFVSRWGALDLDTSALSAIDGSLALTAAGLRIGDLEIMDPTLRATLDSGILTISPLTGQVFDGSFGLQATLAATDPPEIAFEIDLVGGNLADGLASLFAMEGLVGTLDFGIDAATRGATVEAMIAELEGSGLIAVRDGGMIGIDMAEIDTGLSEASEPLDFLERLRGALAGGETPFAAINVPFELDSGVALTETLSAAGDIGRAEGRGMLDLAGERLDVSTEFYLYNHPDAPPFVIQLMGPLGNPVQRPQTQALQAYFAHRAAEALAERFGPEPSAVAEPDEPRRDDHDGVSPAPDPVQPRTSDPEPVDDSQYP